MTQQPHSPDPDQPRQDQSADRPQDPAQESGGRPPEPPAAAPQPPEPPQAPQEQTQQSPQPPQAPPGGPPQGQSAQQPPQPPPGQAQQQGHPGHPPQGDPGYPSQQGAVPVAPPLTPGEEQGWCIGAHLGGILFGFLPALIIWLVFRERSRMVDDHAKEALNFQLTLLIVYLAGTILTLILIGSLIMLAAWICAIIFGILAAMAANQRQAYRYPLTIRFIK